MSKKKTMSLKATEDSTSNEDHSASVLFVTASENETTEWVSTTQRIKIVLLGHDRSGKSSLCYAFKCGRFVGEDDDVDGGKMHEIRDIC